MRLGQLVEASEKISMNRSKGQKIVLIAELLRQARGDDLVLAAHYMSGRLPQGRLGIGWKTLESATIDLSETPQALSLQEIDAYFETISGDTGAGSTGRKTRLLRELLSRAHVRERAFLSRLITGEIRQGALDGLVLDAIARASSLAPERIRQASMFAPNIGEVARVAVEKGSKGLARFKPQLFHPIAPMLASPAEGEAEALIRLGEAGWEYKLDGARIQVHKAGDEVRIFSRHLKDVTASAPEIVGVVQGFPMNEAIFEGEVIALRNDEKPLPFQTTMRRFGRIKNIEKLRREIPLTPFLFDLLYVEGEPLFDTPYDQRVAQLVERVSGEHMVPRIVTAKEEEVRDFLRLSLEAGHEGLMGKGIDSPYIAGHRGFNWLKLKPAHTLDLVILGAEWGSGRRRGWLSNLHLGARVPDSDGFVMLGKTFKGLTDDMLRWQTTKLLELEIGRDTGTVYVRPELVVEIAFSDLQESHRYPGGLALRFARVRQYRPEKTPQETDTIDTVRQIFAASRS
jgi:DNA ligase-1